MPDARRYHLAYLQVLTEARSLALGLVDESALGVFQAVWFKVANREYKAPFGVILLINLFLNLFPLMIHQRRRGIPTIHLAILPFHYDHTVMRTNTVIIKALRWKVVFLSVVYKLHRPYKHFPRVEQAVDLDELLVVGYFWGFGEFGDQHLGLEFFG